MAIEWIVSMGPPPLQSVKFRQTLVGLAIASFVLWALLAQGVGSLAQFALGLLLIVGGLACSYWLLRAAQWGVRRALWRVRHRMVAVFFFVGVLPISIGAVLVAFGVQLLLGPLTGYMIASQFGSYVDRMQATAEPLLWQMQETPQAERLALLQRFRSSAEGDFSGAAFRVDFENARLTSPEGALQGPMPSNLLVTRTLVRMGEGLYLMATAGTDTQSGRVLMSVPVTQQLMQQLIPGLGILAVDPDRSAREAIIRAVDSGTLEQGGRLPPPQHPLDWLIEWPAETEHLDWNTNQLNKTTYILLTRLSAMAEVVFAQQAPETFRLFAMIAALLAAALAASLVISLSIAVSLIRTLTGAVNDLYVGTTHVNRGDFGYRVPIAGTDQISDLSRSFNAMTDSIEKLIEESKSRQRLESELEIAREVQARLFPARQPKVGNLEVLGVCQPAQSVSGDFFDYLPLGDDLLAISFGDVSGKGISAALVMASLHSIVRMQLALLRTEDPGELEGMIARVVERTNQQLCEATSPEKFSTLFFGTYDARNGTLTYSNAGHLPPLLLRGDEITALDVNGMVIGAFPQASYEASTLRLRPGDLLVAFTDGITEPENAAQAEFGEERLKQALRRAGSRPAREIIEDVMNEVVNWTDGSTLQDDMTMLLVRKR